MNISDDSYAMLLMCSDLAIKSMNDGVKTFTISQWSKLADRLVENKLTPSALFDISSDSMKLKLNLSEGEVTRIEKLLSRSGQFGIELEKLNEKGIFILTRADHHYPRALKNKLKSLLLQSCIMQGIYHFYKIKGYQSLDRGILMMLP